MRTLIGLFAAFLAGLLAVSGPALAERMSCDAVATLAEMDYDPILITNLRADTDNDTCVFYVSLPAKLGGGSRAAKAASIFSDLLSLGSDEKTLLRALEEKSFVLTVIDALVAPHGDADQSESLLREDLTRASEIIQKCALIAVIDRTAFGPIDKTISCGIKNNGFIIVASVGSVTLAINLPIA